MELIPAVDMMEGRAVRLVKGDFETRCQVAEDPVAAAMRWASLGARRLHVVDLDGARVGHPVHLEAIGSICAKTGLPVEVGGGVRTEADVQSLIDHGVTWVIIGTTLIEDPELFVSLCVRFPRQLIAAVDGRGDEVLTQGWQTRTGRKVLDVAIQAQEAGAAAILYTDVDKDGAMSGPNLDRTAALASALAIPVIASGGVSSMEDLLRVARTGASHVVVGKALYLGRIDLREAWAALAGAKDDEGSSQV